MINMEKVCKGCEHLKILYEPMMPYELGRAKCTKYNRLTDFLRRNKFSKLKCVGGEEAEDMSLPDSGGGQ